MIASVTVGQYDTAEHCAMRATAYTEDVLNGQGAKIRMLKLRRAKQPNQWFMDEVVLGSLEARRGC